MKCYRVNVVYYVHAEDENDAEMVIQDIGLTESEYYSYHEISEDEDWEDE